MGEGRSIRLADRKDTQTGGEEASKRSCYY
jgi:hypothetical protein